MSDTAYNTHRIVPQPYVGASPKKIKAYQDWLKERQPKEQKEPVYITPVIRYKKPEQQNATVRDIQELVCDFYQIEMTDLLSVRRDRNILEAKHVGFYLARVLTTKSFHQIGRLFGGRDHTTILHGINKVKKRMEDDSEFAETVKGLKDKLTPRP